MLFGLYIEVDIFSALLLFWILFNAQKNPDNRTENIFFTKIIRIDALALIIDIISMTLRYGDGKLFFVLSAIANILYMSFTAIVGYYWMLYVISEYSTYKRFLLSERSRFILSIPCIVLCTLCVPSPETGWIFLMDKNTLTITQGSHYIIQYFISYGYFVASLIFIIIGLAFQREYIRPRFEVSLLYIAMLVVTGILNLIFPGIPAAWPALAFILMMIYTRIQELQISLDGLTRLNNRRSFDIFIKNKIQDGYSFAFYIIDIDKFKSINDTWGHIEGDAAIVAVSDTLRKACKTKSAFIARYGGDEFVIVYLCQSESENENFKKELVRTFEKEEENSTRPYRLMVSIGSVYSDPQEEMRSAEDIIARADKILYKQKAIAHKTPVAPQPRT